MAMITRQSSPRSAEMACLVGCVQDDMCCSLVGLSNTGKSSLLRAMCAGSAAQLAWPGALFYVDCNLMLMMSEQGFYEVTLRAVQSELAPGALQERVEKLYHKVIEPSSAFVGPLSFNESVVALCEQLDRRVVLVFDEFDEPFAQLDGRVFLNLRALRDKYGDRLCLVTATERPLAEIRNDKQVNEFSELFAGSTHVLKMLSPAQAMTLAAEIASRDEVTLTDDELSFIVAEAGGHLGLVLAVTKAVLHVSSSAPVELRALNLSLVRQLLESDMIVRDECARLWSQLTESDQAVLLHLLTTGEGLSTQQRLVSYGILVEPAGPTSDTGPAVFSPLFEAFARRQLRSRLPAQSGVYVEVDSGTAWVDGRPLPTLTDLEYRLLLLLYGRMDKICDKYQIVEAVWGEEFIADVDDGRVDKLISRLRQKLEADPTNPRYLQTARGRGYRLSSG